jgi:hypothetical protein
MAPLGARDPPGPLQARVLAPPPDVVLAGHDHHYERFAPIDGIRSFVVGTGGRSHYPALWALPTSRALNWTTFGVLRLTLRDGRYDWRFLPISGETYTDAGSGTCR